MGRRTTDVTNERSPELRSCGIGAPTSHAGRCPTAPQTACWTSLTRLQRVERDPERDRRGGGRSSARGRRRGRGRTCRACRTGGSSRRCAVSPASIVKWKTIGMKSPYGHGVDHAAQDRPDRAERSFAIASSCSFASMIDQVERSSDLPKTLPEHADPLAVRRRHVVAAAELHHRARLDPEELPRLVLVGEEADVLLDRHPLLAHERDRSRPGRRSGRG